MLVEKERLVELYATTLKIRLFEEKVWELFSQNLIPGTVHLYLGQEAVAAGVINALEDRDWVQSTHRGHGHVIAKGANMNAAMAELLGRRTGSCKGKGGSMHITEFSAGVLGATGVVASGLPIALGAALSAKFRNTDEVVACFFGDGAANNGTFGESLNMSSIWQLPVIWVVENNLYAMGTPIKMMCPSADIAVRADGYCIPKTVVDGNNALEVYKASFEAVERARQGKGPFLIECKTYRLKGHSRFDAGKYRPSEEVEEWVERDAVEIMLNIARQEKALTKAKANRIRKKIEVEVEAAAKFALESEIPDSSETYTDVFTEA
ncbi:MAG: thiamine pyrophosphate-dependent dehydrogenase E1 component subunit alpha [Candidatus Thorarchaeota archaeon]